MNFIDEKFNKIITEFEVLPVHELRSKMILFYKSLPINIKMSLENFLKNYNFWGELEEKLGNFDIFDKKASIFKEKREDFIWLYENLKDFKSKAVLTEVLNNYYNFDFAGLNNVADKIYKHYFDLDLVPYCKDEVLIDVGAYTGDTVLDYFSSYGKDSYRLIYCYEITASMVEYMEKTFSSYDNIVIKNFAVADKNGYLYLDENNSSSSANRAKNEGKVKVRATSLDADIKERVSMIKMDIEGGEYSALLGAKRHIQEDLPKLFLSVYHSNDDLIRIPRLIAEISNDYDFYLRYYGGNIYATEIVLICLPKRK